MLRDVLDTFKALSDKTRLRILRLLMERDLCVCELMDILKMEQSRVSHQLRILRSAGLVEDEREGKWMIYSIPKEKKKMLDAIFNDIFGERLKGSEELDEDRENLEICIKKGVRAKCLP